MTKVNNNIFYGGREGKRHIKLYCTWHILRCEERASAAEFLEFGRMAASAECRLNDIGRIGWNRKKCKITLESWKN
jgi:hypothetical protein